MWRRDAYEFVKEIPAFDLLAGTDRIRLGIEALEPLDTLVEGADAEVRAFIEKRRGQLLYS